MRSDDPSAYVLRLSLYLVQLSGSQPGRLACGRYQPRCACPHRGIAHRSGTNSPRLPSILRCNLNNLREQVSGITPAIVDEEAPQPTLLGAWILYGGAMLRVEIQD